MSWSGPGRLSLGVERALDVPGRRWSFVSRRWLEHQKGRHTLEGLNQQLQHSRNILRTIFDNINDGLLLLDDQGIVLAANRALATLFASKPATLVSQSWELLCQTSPQDPPDRPVSFPGLWVLATLQDGQPRQRRETFVSRYGKASILDMHALPLFAEHPAPFAQQPVSHVLLHVVDVTESIRVESLLLENERLKVGRRLSQVVAHEVNTPLQTILLALDILPETSPTTQRHYVALIQQQIERIGRMLHQLEQNYQSASDRNFGL